MKKKSDAAPVSPDLKGVCYRVQEKSESYERYNFSGRFNDFLKAFFDLAQEYDSLEDFYRVCVTVPYEMLEVSSALYLCSSPEQDLALVCSSERGVLKEPEPAAYPVQLHHAPYETAGSFVIPICSKHSFDTGKAEAADQNEMQQKELWSGLRRFCGGGHALGMYEIRHYENLTDEDKFFFVKYANRIGFNLDNRLIALQNIDHLKFINTLVVDIEHNIIVPNMYFRHLFNQLKKKIVELESLKGARNGASLEDQGQQGRDNWVKEVDLIQEELLHYHQEIVKHHTNISMFLESLFRREHFERGHLVLHPKRCYVEKEVIAPQLEHYASRLRAANVTVDRPKNMLEEEFQIYVDVGLLSQVYANLFSNASKYTREVIDHEGKPRKAMAYGREIVNNFPMAGKKGIKFNVFSTGPSMSVSEGNALFVEGIRGENSQNVPGTGHGLSFIRHVVEMHGGKVGYEPTPQGNNFYFILPIPPLDHPPALVEAVR